MPYSFCCKKALWILGRVKPMIMEADVDFSLGDPALTGGATGVISLCPVCYGKKCRIIRTLKALNYIFWAVFP